MPNNIAHVADMASSTPLVGMRPWTLLWLICTFLLTPTPLDPIISGGFFEDRQRGNCQLRSCKTCCYGRSSTWTILTGNTQAGTYLAAAKIGRAPGYHVTEGYMVVPRWIMDEHYYKTSMQRQRWSNFNNGHLMTCFCSGYSMMSPNCPLLLWPQ
jgi:hypothetical protein